ncbi:Mce protein [Mycobacterium sp. AZCC_0083]|uniref:Mce protein n=1 Tax=Mycobacterium sp. AZCC_0083 TaxID=2735882 RepID=UPI0018124E90|nr:Mce protein [Mycobacterium sp. AZCC_0083]MBB5163653.1 Mce-associated membrane protein [Mycobacterium sp. AZCC_0083]
MEMKVFKPTNGSSDVFDMLRLRDDLPDIEEANSAADDEAAEATEDALDDAHETPAVSRSRRLLRRGIVVAAGILFVAALGMSGFLGWQLKQEHDTAAAGRAALAVAQSYAVTLTSVDTKDIDHNFAQVLDGATGEFKDMYSQSATQLRQVLIDNKAVSHGTVVDAAIKSTTKTKVEVLLFVDQSISNVVNPEPRIDRNRVEMTMELIDNRWLASKLDIQ